MESDAAKATLTDFKPGDRVICFPGKRNEWWGTVTKIGRLYVYVKPDDERYKHPITLGPACIRHVVVEDVV